MEWLETANGLIGLISGLCGLIGAGVSIFFMIKALISNMRTKTKEQNWAFIMEVADSAMKSVEKSQKEGKDKKEMVIQAVNDACKTAGIELNGFIEQLSAYIDQCIDFANSISGKK